MLIHLLNLCPELSNLRLPFFFFYKTPISGIERLAFLLRHEVTATASTAGITLQSDVTTPENEKNSDAY